MGWIGTESQPYTGTFNGKDKTITGLTVNQEGTNYVGLIGYLGSGGKVQNVTLTDVSVTGYWYVGGVVGANDKGTMTGCTVSGSVSDDSSVGGVVGWNGGTVTACYWSGLPDNDNGGATKVDGTNVTWQTAVDAMNAALQNAGSEWRYELTGALPTLKKQ